MPIIKNGSSQNNGCEVFRSKNWNGLRNKRVKGEKPRVYFEYNIFFNSRILNCIETREFMKVQRRLWRSDIKMLFRTLFRKLENLYRVRRDINSSRWAGRAWNQVWGFHILIYLLYDFTYKFIVFVTVCKACESPRKTQSQHEEKWAQSPTSNGAAIDNW